MYGRFPRALAEISGLMITGPKRASIPVVIFVTLKQKNFIVCFVMNSEPVDTLAWGECLAYPEPVASLAIRTSDAAVVKIPINAAPPLS